MAKIATINVLDIRDRQSFSVHALASFPDDPEGKDEAQSLFAELITSVLNRSEEDWSEGEIQAEIEDAIDNGFYEVGDGGIYLIHST